MLSTVVWTAYCTSMLPVQNGRHVVPRHVYAAIHAVSSRRSSIAQKNQHITTTFQQVAVTFSRKGCSFLGAQGFLQASVGLDPDQEEAGGGRKKDGLTGLRGHHSVLAGTGSVWPPGTPWGVPHLRAAVFLDAAGMRLVSDRLCGGGDQREVKWTGGRPGCEARGSM